MCVMYSSWFLSPFFVVISVAKKRSVHTYLRFSHHFAEEHVGYDYVNLKREERGTAAQRRRTRNDGFSGKVFRRGSNGDTVTLLRLVNGPGTLRGLGDS